MAWCRCLCDLVSICARRTVERPTLQLLLVGHELSHPSRVEVPRSLENLAEAEAEDSTLVRSSDRN